MLRIVRARSPLSTFAEYVVKFIHAVGSHTVFGRGKSRRLLLDMITLFGVEKVQSHYRGVPYYFNFDNTTERQALFGRYDNKELDFIMSRPKEKSADSFVFIDVGANSGFYTQYVAFNSPQNSKIIAIEPNPDMSQRMMENLALLKERKNNTLGEVIVENYAVGDENKAIFLDLTLGVGGANVIEQKSKSSIKIQMTTLVDIVQRNAVSKIDALKIDIEGYEDRALLPFFTSVPKKLYPKRIVIEHTSKHLWTTDVLEYLLKIGYREELRLRGNSLLSFEEG